MKTLVTRCQISDTKSGLAEPKYTQFEKWRQANKHVKVVQQDNAEENKKLQAKCDQAA